MKSEEIKKVLNNGSFGVVFPKAKDDEKAAIELADLIDNAKAVASFADSEDENKTVYGVIVKIILLKDNEEENGEM